MRARNVSCTASTLFHGVGIGLDERDLMGMMVVLKAESSSQMTAISIGIIGLTPVTNYGVSTKIAQTGFLNRITPLHNFFKELYFFINKSYSNVGR